MRKIFLLLAACAVLAGCGRSGERNLMLAPPPQERAMLIQDKPQVFVYSHALSLVMAHDAVRGRYDRARETCLKDAALHCRLLIANASEYSGNASAHLKIALPHDKIEAYEARVLKPLPEDKDGVEIRSRSTEAQSVETEADDTAKKIAQLTKYRDGLTELARRPNLSVGDYIRVQGELSKTEAELDEALDSAWSNEGFVSREHEEARLAAARTSLRLSEVGRNAKALASQRLFSFK